MTEKWDRRFLDLAKHISEWSLDPSTKVGAVAVKDRRVLATGYNGLPRGIADLPGRLNNRDEKYLRTVHAEANIVAQAARFGIDMSGSTVYVWPFLPCCNCTTLMIQAGIRRIVVPELPIPDRWQANFNLSVDMLRESSVDLMQLLVEEQ
jgi:dCMP deaminase